ncbi:MAG TPA: hypothetical protein VFH32_06530, partial [Rubrobacteraceae bacterium]|nr:hypothetical protein [Rubrobacteraceae bacterium]
PAVLAPGLEMFSQLTNRPFFGTLPYVDGLGLDGEDSLALDAKIETKSPLGRDVLRVAVARLGRISNFTDFDALAHEPGVFVSFTTSATEILAADLAIVPGTKATVSDLAGLRSRGLSGALAERARRGLPTLGVCGGYQMLGERIVDGIESGDGEAPGLGLLPVETVFDEEKLLARPAGGRPFSGTPGSRGTRFGTGGCTDMAAIPSSWATASTRDAGPAPSSGPPGTALWSPTPSAGISCAGWPINAASTGCRARSPSQQRAR